METNGKNTDSDVELSDQSFFIQRILNRDQRFARSPSFIYAAVGYIEKNDYKEISILLIQEGKELIMKIVM